MQLPVITASIEKAGRVVERVLECFERHGKWKLVEAGRQGRRGVRTNFHERVGFILTKMARPASNDIDVYNKSRALGPPIPPPGAFAGG